MTSIFHSGLLKDFSSILNDADDFNVIINVGEKNNTRKFRAHSVILRARSEYFKSALSTEWVTKENGIIMFNKPNITLMVFDMILKYLYTGELNLGDYIGSIILELLVATDELLLGELFEHVQDYLTKKQTAWVQENLFLVLHIAFKITRCKILQDYCLEFICSDLVRPFITSENFLSLEKDALYGLLKRDDLHSDEIVIWDSLIKWGIKQTPGLGSENSDRTKWNNENYEALKKTLNQHIPLIRFVEISPAEYFDKVRPYKTVLPYHIYEEIEEFYFKGTLPKTVILSPRNHIKSSIIKSEFISMILNWIERKDASVTRNKDDSLYEFNLIYRGSRDGIDTNSCRNKCNLGDPILVLVKCHNTRTIFGGFTPVGFYKEMKFGYSKGNNSYISSRDSFIFKTFEENDKQNLKINRVTSYNNAIFNNYSSIGYGFNFGGDLYMKDNNLYIGNSGNYAHYKHSYYKNDSYMIEEIEAFRVYPGFLTNYPGCIPSLPCDNRADNLEWITPKENTERRIFQNHGCIGSRKIVQKMLDGNVVQIWDSIRFASNARCNGKQKTSGGCIMYDEDHIEPDPSEEWKEIELDSQKFRISSLERIQLTNGEITQGSLHIGY
ncbi:hypothetical protein RhiirB3_525391 [Rhizophagus irregularis]|nr:hypothetical protein RhiirB3_525391 [Rhizophagus irregularis]